MRACAFCMVHFWNAGTSLYYDPGMLYGGDVEHNCNLQRSIGYYLEVLLCLAPFTKQMLRATLTGVTSDQIDPSVSILLVFMLITQHEWGYQVVKKLIIYSTVLMGHKNVTEVSGQNCDNSNIYCVSMMVDHLYFHHLSSTSLSSLTDWTWIKKIAISLFLMSLNLRVFSVYWRQRAMPIPSGVCWW